MRDGLQVGAASAGAVGVWGWVVVSCTRDAPSGASAVSAARSSICHYLSIYLYLLAAEWVWERAAFGDG